MLSLVIKDIIVQKKTVLLSLVYVVFFIFAFQSIGPSGFTAAAVAVTYILVVTSAAYDDKNKADIMLNSLPVKRSDIVFAKYLSVFIYAAIGIIAYILASAGAKVLMLPVRVYSVTLETFVGGLFAIILLNSIYFPVFFKFGYMKSRIVNFILFFVFFFGVQAVAEFKFTRNIMLMLDSLPDFEIASIIMGIGVVILIISYALSLWFYKNREF